MSTEAYDIVVVGGGTAGTFAAATAASEGLDAIILERKSADEAGHIACGDAIKERAHSQMSLIENTSNQNHSPTNESSGLYLRTLVEEALILTSLITELFLIENDMERY